MEEDGLKHFIDKETNYILYIIHKYIRIVTFVYGGYPSALVFPRASMYLHFKFHLYRFSGAVSRESVTILL